MTTLDQIKKDAIEAADKAYSARLILEMDNAEPETPIAAIKRNATRSAIEAYEAAMPKLAADRIAEAPRAWAVKCPSGYLELGHTDLSAIETAARYGDGNSVVRVAIVELEGE